MNLVIILVDLLMFFVGLSLGFFVFARNPRNRIFQFFSVTAAGMAGWNLSIFLLLAGLLPAVIPGRTTFSFGILLITGFAWFVFYFPTRMRGAKVLSWIFGILGLIFFIIPLTPAFLTWVEVVDGSINGDLNPALFGAITMYTLAAYLFTFVVLLVRAIRAKGVDRLRLWQVLLGFSLFLFPMLTTQLFLPLVFQDFRWNNLGPAFSIFLIAFLANAILNYRLLDIRWIVSKSLLLSVLSGLVVWIVFSTTFLLSSLVDPTIGVTIGALVVVIFYKPLSYLIEKFVARVANKGSYDPEKATKEVFEIVRNHGELDQLMEKLLSAFARYFSADQIGMVVFASGANRVVGSLESGFDSGFRRMIPKLTTVMKAHKNQIAERDELGWQAEYNAKASAATKTALKAMKETGVDTLIPFALDGHVAGFMVFGKRRYDRALRSRDIQFLDLIRAGISPALENAAKYAEMKALYAKLSEADRVKSEFINVVSHRFRTPLSALRWNLETVIDTARLNRDAKDMLVDSQNRTMFLVNTLEGLFDTLALESGKLKLSKTVFSVTKALKPLMGQFLARAEEKGIAFTPKIAAMKAFGDEKRIVHICDMLITNAIQYTQSGSVGFTVGKSGTSTMIQVTDTGIGIPKKDQKKIFDKFYRAKNAVSAYADGQGIGLYLVKQLVDLHKGSLELQSEEGKGTTITILLPNK